MISIPSDNFKKNYEKIFRKISDTSFRKFRKEFLRNKHLRIVFKEHEFLLIGNIKSGGAIATKKQFDNFEESYAHLTANGDIIRWGQKIGRIEEIIFLTEGKDD